MVVRLETKTASDGVHERSRLDSRLEHRIAEMHQLLDGMAPTTAAVALKTLREAFPETSLAQRVQALRRH